MNFLQYSNLKGTHAYLSASNPHWLGYTEEQLILAYKRHQAAMWGTKLHEHAANSIELGIRLPDEQKTLNMYINDAIGYHMTPEQILYVSPNCYGTADAISFRHNQLRIHDLKTGITPAKMEQLLIYNAMFCMNYDIKPSDIDTELRLYQGNDIIAYKPEIDDIVPIMDKMETFDRIINELKAEG